MLSEQQIQDDSATGTGNFGVSRRGLLAGALGFVALGVAACGDSSDSSSGSSTATSATSAAAGDDVPTLESLTAEVKSKFQQSTYQDADTGKSLPYNIYVPEDYDKSKSYPLVLYIPDSSLVGQDVTAPLSQYGALVWASAAEQAKHQSLVLVPAFPSVIIDDHGSFTTTEYVEMTRRLLSSVTGEYSVDAKRVYGTGQSMGCMTVMYLTAKHPDLFAAELFVSGQWDISELKNLAKEKFFYIAAGGDENASAGQVEVQQMLTAAGVSFQKATWDATWTAEQFTTAAAELFAAGDSINFATFTTGTVTQVSGSSSSAGGPGGGMGMPSGGPGGGMGRPSGGPGGGMGMPSGGPGGGMGMPSGGPGAGGLSMGGASTSEHMASFEPAYKITALRDWLFEQSA